MKYLKKFKGETLRKYWRRLRLTFKTKKLINIFMKEADRTDHQSKILYLVSQVNKFAFFSFNKSNIICQ